MSDSNLELRAIELWHEADQLHRALLKHGYHTNDCFWNRDGMAGPCTCGWLELREKLEGARRGCKASEAERRIVRDKCPYVLPPQMRGWQCPNCDCAEGKSGALSGLPEGSSK